MPKFYLKHFPLSKKKKKKFSYLKKKKERNCSQYLWAKIIFCTNSYLKG